MKAIVNLYNQIKNEPDTGKVASYIPELAKVDPNKFGIFLTTTNGQEDGVGDRIKAAHPGKYSIAT